MKKSISNDFLNSMWEFASQEFNADLIEEVKSCVIDYVACTNIGKYLLQDAMKDYISMQSFDKGNCSIIGSDCKTNMVSAAMINGIHSHYIELDDGHRYGMIHLGAPVISAMIAVSQTKDLSVHDFIRGIIVGYEATIRLARAVQPDHKLKGYHATGTCGTIGAAIGLASATGMPRDRWNTVLSVAATDAAGILQVIDDGSELKAYNAGRAASAAVNAMLMGYTGLKGPSDVLGGERGFFRVLCGKIDETILVKDSVSDYEIKKIYKKPYAACRHCHSAIEAAIKLHNSGVDFGDIEEVTVETYSLAVKGHDHKEILGEGSAKMSIPYSVAAAFVFGKVNYAEYNEECLNNVDVKVLTQKINVVEDPELSKLVPAKRVAVLKVRTKTGEYTKSVDYPLGEPENPISKEMLEEKYYALMDAAMIEREKSKRIIENIYNIENEFDSFIKNI